MGVVAGWLGSSLAVRKSEKRGGSAGDDGPIGELAEVSARVAGMDRAGRGREARPPWEPVERAVSVGAGAMDRSGASSTRGRDRHLPHSRAYFLNGTRASERAASRGRGNCGPRSSPEGEVFDAHTTRFVDTVAT